MKVFMNQKFEYYFLSTLVIRTDRSHIIMFSGVLQYELHLAIFMVTQLDTDPDWGPTDAQNAEMLRAFQSLEQCIWNLRHEQEGTFESMLCKGAVVGLLKSGYPLPRELMDDLGHLKYTLGGLFG